ncbi:MAG: ATP-binding protein [Methanobrevibacter sp.]|nr:ATP-binding protein [Methanobrevibacter sp.]
MGNSLLDIKPHKISRDLRGYSIMFYGEPKSGKTTISSRFPGALVLAFEKGYNAIAGIMAKPLNTWGDFKKVLTELRDPEVKEVFQTVVIDTADIAYGLCEKYICSRESDAKNTYEQISDLPFGKGYKLAQQEFDECLRKILQMDYGLILISHAVDKTFKDEAGVEYNQIIPTLDNKARLVCERTCDIIGYSRQIQTEEGPQTKLFMRGTPRFVAGSRFRFTPDYIDFDYDALVNAISEAIDKEAAVSGAALVTNAPMSKEHLNEPHYNFEALMNEFQDLVGDIMSKTPSMASKITAIVDKHLGRGKKVGDCTPDQAPQIDLILFDLKRL